MAHALKVGDTGPSLRATLYGDDGKPVNLNGVTSLKLKAHPAIAGVGGTIDRAALVDYSNPNDPLSPVDPTLGKVRYDFQAADTVAQGVMRAYFHVVWASGQSASYPSDDYLDIVVRPA